MLSLPKYKSISFRFLSVNTKPFSRNLSDIKKDDTDGDSERLIKKGPREQLKKEETAADRLNKILSSMHADDNLSKLKQVNMAKAGSKKNGQKREDLSGNILQALKKVTSHFKEEHKQQIESELLNKLLMHSEEATVARATKDEKSIGNEVTLSDLIVGMKIDRRQAEVEYSRGNYVRKSLANHMGPRPQPKEFKDRLRGRNQHRQPESNTGNVDLFGSKDLRIFKEPSKICRFSDVLKTWEGLYQHELKQFVTHPPANYFQKMALWTEQGKLWKFPIDNEQGLSREAATDFSEHVLLEQHLEQWCPNKGPIRHYMELVCVGLAKNPFVSAREKKEHILWYRDYFNGKKEILKEVIVEQNVKSKKIEMFKI